MAVLLLVLTLGGGVRGDDLEDEEDIPVTGIEQKSIQLACTLPSSDPPRVRWLDYVYNSDPNPSKIFDSWNNSELHTSDTHPNGRSYEVTLQISLTDVTLRLFPLDGPRMPLFSTSIKIYFLCPLLRRSECITSGRPQLAYIFHILT